MNDDWDLQRTLVVIRILEQEIASNNRQIKSSNKFERFLITGIIFSFPLLIVGLIVSETLEFMAALISFCSFAGSLINLGWIYYLTQRIRKLSAKLEQQLSKYYKKKSQS